MKTAKTRSIPAKRQELLNAIARGEAKVMEQGDGRKVIKKAAPNISEKKKVRRSFLGGRIFYSCPRCGKNLVFHRKAHSGLCMSCGQRLDWNKYDSMAGIWLEVHDAEEAGYWAEQYAMLNGMTYGIDLDSWQKSIARKPYPMQLYFAFPNEKDYGKFMREAAKEGKITK